MVPRQRAIDVDGAVWRRLLRVIKRRRSDNDQPFKSISGMKNGTPANRTKPSVDQVSTVRLLHILSGLFSQPKFGFRNDCMCCMTRTANAAAVRAIALNRR